MKYIASALPVRDGEAITWIVDSDNEDSAYLEAKKLTLNNDLILRGSLSIDECTRPFLVLLEGFKEGTIGTRTLVKMVQIDMIGTLEFSAITGKEYITASASLIESFAESGLSLLMIDRRHDMFVVARNYKFEQSIDTAKEFSDFDEAYEYCRTKETKAKKEAIAS